MNINWHKQQQTYLNASFVGHIRTGETRNVSNWRTALTLRKRLDIWDEAWECLSIVATSGKDLQAGIPEVERFTVEGKELAVVYGVIQKGVTPMGKVEGEYKFVLCDADEILLVLAKEFRIKERLKWRMA